jgi:hypothetical protein
MDYTLRYSFDLEDIYEVAIKAMDANSALVVATTYIENEHNLPFSAVKAISIVERG